jgi:aryl-alcohol dehydrogenase-like predicted oxidoreductase
MRHPGRVCRARRVAIVTTGGGAHMTRRDFLRLAVAATVAPAACGGGGGGAAAGSPVTRRKLGRTGEAVSLVGLGGWHMARPGLSEDDSVAIVRAAIDGGVTFLDNCWDYNGGESERRMGLALRGGYRERAFLMTKIDGRTREAAARQIDDSLRRLGTDRIDLMQLHEVIHGDDPDRAFREGGAVAALDDARRAGKIRFVGFTGHKSPAIHLAMLDAADAHGFRFDTVQMPLNVLDAHYDSFEHQVLPRLLGAEIGVIGMKPMADARIVDEGIASADEALRYAMSLPTSVVVTGCDSLERVAQAVRLASGFTPLSEQAVGALLARTAPRAEGGASELYKTTTQYDGTTQNPEWLG